MGGAPLELAWCRGRCCLLTDGQNLMAEGKKTLGGGRGVVQDGGQDVNRGHPGGLAS